MRGKCSKILLILVTCSTFALSGCGSESSGLKLVKDVDFATYDLNGEAYVEVTFELDTGNIMMPSIDIPIVDPGMPGVELGHLSILNIPSGGADLVLAV